MYLYIYIYNVVYYTRVYVKYSWKIIKRFVGRQWCVLCVRSGEEEVVQKKRKKKKRKTEKMEGWTSSSPVVVVTRYISLYATRAKADTAAAVDSLPSELLCRISSSKGCQRWQRVRLNVVEFLVSYVCTRGKPRGKCTLWIHFFFFLPMLDVDRGTCSRIFFTATLDNFTIDTYTRDPQSSSSLTNTDKNNNYKEIPFPV